MRRRWLSRLFWGRSTYNRYARMVGLRWEWPGHSRQYRGGELTVFLWWWQLRLDLVFRRG